MGNSKLAIKNDQRQAGRSSFAQITKLSSEAIDGGRQAGTLLLETTCRKRSARKIGAATTCQLDPKHKRRKGPKWHVG